jgi:general secretion pathway protein I
MRAAFTLLEVMIALAFIGIAMVALLGLHQNNLQAVIRAQDLTKASLLAQAIMSQAEIERFPQTGISHGDFSELYPNQFPNFSWQRVVADTPAFPDVRQVQVRVFYGPNGDRVFGLVEFLHNPNPPPLPGNAGANDSGTTDEPPPQ